MSDFQSILVPLDCTSWSEQALPLAEHLARLRRASLDVVMVHQPAPIWCVPDCGPGFTSYDQAVRLQEALYLERVAGRFGAATRLPAGSNLLDGDIVPAIADYVRDHDIGLVVLTVHSRDGLSRLWLGGVASSLVRLLTIPVLALHPSHQLPVMPPSVQRILLPLDGSAWAASIVPQAKEMARLTGVTIVLAMVAPTEATGASRQERQRYLEKMVKELVGDGLPTESRFLVAGHPARQILALATKERCDMIALVPHMPASFHHVLRASVVDRIIRDVRVPVLIQRGPTAMEAPITAGVGSLRALSQVVLSGPRPLGVAISGKR